MMIGLSSILSQQVTKEENEEELLDQEEQGSGHDEEECEEEEEPVDDPRPPESDPTTGRAATSRDGDERRTFIFRLEPVLSGSSSCRRGGDDDNENIHWYDTPCTDQGWGWFYDGNHPSNRDERSLRQTGKFSELLASNHPHKIASVRTAQEWIFRHGLDIFETIFNLPYIDMIYEQDLQETIRKSNVASTATLARIRIQSTFEFARVEIPKHKNYIDLILREHRSLPPLLSRLLEEEPTVLNTILHAMHREVWAGGDTWEGGDFGNIPDGKGQGGRIQITFSDPDSDWVVPKLPTDFGRGNTDCLASNYNFNDYGRTGGKSGLSEMGSIFVFVAFVLAAVWRFCCLRHDDDGDDLQ